MVGGRHQLVRRVERHLGEGRVPLLAEQLRGVGVNRYHPLATAVQQVGDAARGVAAGFDLAALVRAVHLSRATLRNIKQNLFWAFIYNLIGIPFAAGVVYLFGGPLLSPIFAGAAMAFSSVSVVTNALHERYRRLQTRPKGATDIHLLNLYHAFQQVKSSFTKPNSH